MCIAKRNDIAWDRLKATVNRNFEIRSIFLNLNTNPIPIKIATKQSQ